LHRERQRLMKERNALGNRIGSLLATQGIRLPLRAGFQQDLRKARCWSGEPLCPHLVAEIERMWVRRQLLGQQLNEVQRQRCRELADENNPIAAPVRQLMRLRGIGINTSWVLSTEVFVWREVANRRQLGALAGMTPTPFNSGKSEREQGIGKAGIKWVRTPLIEIAWDWVRLQPGSELTQWFRRRFDSGSKRSRRIGIVALARKLLVALWRYHHDGDIPAGAVLKAA
jgi:transposase